jgi:hypothetical protein
MKIRGDGEPKSEDPMHSKTNCTVRHDDDEG